MKRPRRSCSGGSLLSMVQTDDGFVDASAMVEEEKDEDMVVVRPDVIGGGGGGEKKRRLKRPSSLLSVIQSDDGFVDAGAVEEDEADEDVVMVTTPDVGGDGSSGGFGEKKRRLGKEQVCALERIFETENRLGPERKARVARDLGLHPRQVAVWFQNRRARWKTKQMERDYVALRPVAELGNLINGFTQECKMNPTLELQLRHWLRQSYDALRADHDALRRDKDALLAEIKELKAKLGDEGAAASFSSVKEEPVASDVEPPAAAAATTAAPGPSESDSSGVVNDVVEKAEADAEAVVPGAAAPLQGDAFVHGQMLKLEDVYDEAALFLGGSFFTDLWAETWS